MSAVNINAVIQNYFISLQLRDVISLRTQTYFRLSRFSPPKNNGGENLDSRKYVCVRRLRRDQQQPEIRLHSQAKSPQVITYMSLLFEVVETPTSEIPASQELFTLGLVVCGSPCVRLGFFLIFGAKKGSLSSADSWRTVSGVRELQPA